jgi:hypothetical protein
VPQNIKSSYDRFLRVVETLKDLHIDFSDFRDLYAKLSIHLTGYKADVSSSLELNVLVFELKNLMG